MAAQFNSIFGNLISTGVSWFEDLLEASGYAGFYLSAIFLILTFRFLLRPIFGFAWSLGSDRARSKNDSED